MSYLYALLDWRLINLIAPFVGITVCVYLLMSKNTCTVQKSISTILALGVLSWLMLIWADWGSTIFEPSYQSALARVIMVFMMLIVAFVLRRSTKRNRSLSIKTRILSAENELLKEQLNIMHGKTEPTQE
ncbi:hypothetical protein [Psychrobacter piscatorii]|uniref:hypothetical protein n=1 Tax=Psychrobacter piscatorii TaxID=554343 RepID=UPI0037366F81